MCIGLGDIMKKFVSILIALSLAISSLFAFSINAYANSLKTAVQIMLGQSINATGIFLESSFKANKPSSKSLRGVTGRA
jgi:hypothetical protein